MEAYDDDCIVIGAGPAGSAAATLLAQAGQSVLIVEKSAFPRFHVGESLLPASNAMLRRLGIWDELEARGCPRKYGAEFLYGSGERSVHAVFADGMKADYAYTFQVERAAFDTILLQRAIAVGAAVQQPATVTRVARHGAGWAVTMVGTGGSTETRTARWLLDASGRASILAKTLGLSAQPYPLAKRFAVYNHFLHVDRRTGQEAGNITITRLADGWFWSIPIDERRTSVGLVTRGQQDGRKPADVFRQSVNRNPFMRNWMRNAEPLDEFRVEADFSFRRTRIAGENWLLIGDAAGFIDPVFSSGVYLALESARLGTDAILGGTGCLSPAQQHCYQREMTSRQNLIFSLVRLFYDNQAFSVFMSPQNGLQLFDAVNAVIAGRAERDFSIRWRFALFRAICGLNRHLPLTPTAVL